jgi:nucleoid-associated protein YgaU
MDRLEELKQKYSGAIQLIHQSGVKLAHMHVQDNKLFLQGAAPSQDVKNQVWNAVKSVDSSYSDLTLDLSIDPSLAPAPATPTASSQKTYTVQPGDTLSKIAKEFYGNANEYNKIFQANQDKLQSPDKIQVGQQLVIP